MPAYSSANPLRTGGPACLRGGAERHGARSRRAWTLRAFLRRRQVRKTSIAGEGENHMGRRCLHFREPMENVECLLHTARVWMRGNSDEVRTFTPEGAVVMDDCAMHLMDDRHSPPRRCAGSKRDHDDVLGDSGRDPGRLLDQDAVVKQPLGEIAGLVAVLTREGCRKEECKRKG